MPFPKELLSRDEQIALDLKPHWWFIAPPAFFLAVALVIGILVLVNTDGDGFSGALRFIVGIGVLFALGNFVYRYTQWITTNFVVTNERVISRSGIVAKKGIEIPLDRINTVFFDQTIFERMIGAGDLGIESAGEGGRQNFEDVRRPNLVQQEIYRQKETFEHNQRAALGATIAASMPAAATVSHGAPSIPEQIEQLDRLRRAGSLTDDEFQAKKAELLRRM